MTIRAIIFISILVNILAISPALSKTNEGKTLPPLNFDFNSASVQTKDDKLVVSTGKVKHTWRLTDQGLITIGLKDLITGREWCDREPAFKCDWSLNGLIEDTTSCVLVSLTAEKDNDELFTSDHIKVLAEFHYSTNIGIQYEIWAYPGATGLRTQVLVKQLHGVNKNLHYLNSSGFSLDKQFNAHDTDRSLYLPIKWQNLHRRAVGYYAGTQQRNAANNNLLKEKYVTASVIQPEKYDWNSALIAEDSLGGLAVIKESHKCVNQPGLNTGYFRVDRYGLRASGWGITVPFFTSERYRECWANWIIIYDGDKIEGQQAIKEFDRLRYPVDPDRDMYILANTWGSGNHRAAAKEDNVMIELESQSDLGIDVQQIDDGWQNPVELHWTQTTKWQPHISMYPEGWKNVVGRAKELDVTLGLWQAIGMHARRNIDRFGDNACKLSDLKRNFDQGGFRYYKFDFSLIEDYDDKEELMQTVREFVKYTDHKVRVNWDVTEVEPRIGYFFGREYGNIYLENRKPRIRPDVVYVPFQVLRDGWHLSKYVNLNKFQMTVQNIDRCDTIMSNAYQYNHPYSVAITLMSSPIFFQETHLYSKEAKDQIRPLLTKYKEHRAEIFKGYVYQIGDEPNDKSWTGFQCHRDDDTGYLLIFRELHNNSKEKKIRLNFLRNSRLKITNIMSGEEIRLKTDINGIAQFKMDKAADYRFYRYEIL